MTEDLEQPRDSSLSEVTENWTKEDKPFEIRRADLESRVREIEDKHRRWDELEIPGSIPRPFWHEAIDKHPSHGSRINTDPDMVSRLAENLNPHLSITAKAKNDSPDAVVVIEWEPNDQGGYIEAHQFSGKFDAYIYMRGEPQTESFVFAQLQTVPDIIECIRNPDEKVAENKKEREESILQHDCESVLGDLIRFSGYAGAPGIYDLRDEGSGALTQTFGELFYRAFDSETSRKIVDLVDGEWRDNRSWNSSGARKAEEKLQQLIDLKPLDGVRILDIGCGRTARFLHLLQDLGAEITGLDIMKRREETPESIFSGDITEWESIPEPVRANKYDFVLTTMTFVGEAAGEGGLSNALEMLDDGGVFISTPGLSDNKYFPYDLTKNESKDPRFFNFRNTVDGMETAEWHPSTIYKHKN